MIRPGRVFLGLLCMVLLALVGVLVFVQFVVPDQFEDRDRELAEHTRTNANAAAAALAGQPDVTEPTAVRLVGDHGGSVRSYDSQPTLLVVVAEFSARGSGVGGSVLVRGCFRLEVERGAATSPPPRVNRLERCPPVVSPT